LIHLTGKRTSGAPLSQHGAPTEGEGGLARPATSIREVSGDSEKVGRQARPILAQRAGVAKQKPRVGAGLSWVFHVVTITHHPNAQPHRWLHTARENSHEKAPQRRGASGAKSTMRGRRECKERQPQRYSVAQHSQHSVTAGTNCYVPRSSRPPNNCYVSTHTHDGSPAARSPPYPGGQYCAAQRPGPTECRG
jgi:hypothetical protein